MQEHNSRLITVDDRPLENGDTATIDFEGFVDGVAFEGGKGENYPLTIGSGQFIPGFEEQLIGAKIGEDVEVNVTFPEDYQAEDLAGKAAVFKCKVNEIKETELPDADDEFASEVSDFVKNLIVPSSISFTETISPIISSNEWTNSDFEVLTSNL